jgi:hypothetical protein
MDRGKLEHADLIVDSLTEIDLGALGLTDTPAPDA